jgi:two-component system NtrC family sensor kinase
MAMLEPRSLVLIIDVDSSTVQLLKGVFEHEGYEVKTAFNGVDGLALIETTTPDLIILGTRLGGQVDGFGVLRLLREMENTARTPTFLMSANLDLPEMIEVLRLGADDYIRKPIHPKELLVRAQAKIRNHRLDEALARRTRDLEALLRVSEVLSESQEWDIVTERVLLLANELLPSHYTAFGVWEESEFTVLHVTPASERERFRFYLTSHYDEITRVGFGTFATTGLFGEQGTGLVGLLSFSQSLGRFAVLYLFREAGFDAQHVQLFQGLCKQAGLAVQNADLYRAQAHYAANLEHEVEARTRELRATQDRLIQAARLASIGQLAAGIAHEINNPLMPIRLNLESLIEDIQMGLALDAELLTITLHSVERIQNLVRRLLRFNEGQRGSQEYTQTVNVHDVLNNVFELTQKTFQQGKKLIRLSLKAKQNIVSGNADALTQVFLNLALNARESMEAGGTLTITTKNQDGALLVRFEDTGSGIAPELLDRIFDPFFTTKNDGSGLGLFVSYGILQSHGADIRVESAVGKGSTFEVTMPLPTAKSGH